MSNIGDGGEPEGPQPQRHTPEAVRPQDRCRFQAFDKHAEALGYLVLWWGRLDYEIDRLIKQMASNSPDVYVIRADLDLRARIKIAKNLAFSFDIFMPKAPNHPHSAWYNRLITALRLPGGTLADRRNRMMHDNWHSSGLLSSLKPSIQKNARL